MRGLWQVYRKYAAAHTHARPKEYILLVLKLEYDRKAAEDPAVIQAWFDALPTSIEEAGMDWRMLGFSSNTEPRRSWDA